MIAYAIGPLFLGPLSEIFGRVLVLRWSNFLFLIFNTASGSVMDRDSMIALRFLSGLCACAPQTVGRMNAKQLRNIVLLSTNCTIDR